MTKPLKAQSRRGSLQEEILHLSAEKFRWKAARQIDRIEDLFDDELIFIHLNGTTSSKHEWLGELRSGRFIYDSIDQIEATAKVYQDTAVLVGKALFTVTMLGFQTKYRLAYTEVYANKDSHWKLVNLHTCSF